MSVSLSNYLLNNSRIMPALSTTGSALDAAGAAASAEGTAAATFADLLSEAMGNTVATDAESKLGDLQLITGESQDLHSVLIAGEKADIMLNLTVQIRNRMVEGYQEIMRMQI